MRRRCLPQCGLDTTDAPQEIHNHLQAHRRAAALELESYLRDGLLSTYNPRRRECVASTVCDIHTPASLCARAFTEPAAFSFATSRIQSARDPDQLVPFECGTLDLWPRRFGAACECCPEQAANWGAVADIIKPGQRGAFARGKMGNDLRHDG